jgi:hypothetical protein
MPDNRKVDPQEEELPDVEKMDASTWKNTLKGWYNRPNKKLVVKETRIIMKIPQRTK